MISKNPSTNVVTFTTPQDFISRYGIRSAFHDSDPVELWKERSMVDLWLAGLLSDHVLQVCEHDNIQSENCGCVLACESKHRLRCPNCGLLNSNIPRLTCVSLAQVEAERAEDRRFMAAREQQRQDLERQRLQDRIADSTEVDKGNGHGDFTPEVVHEHARTEVFITTDAEGNQDIS